VAGLVSYRQATQIRMASSATVSCCQHQQVYSRSSGDQKKEKERERERNSCEQQVLNAWYDWRTNTGIRSHAVAWCHQTCLICDAGPRCSSSQTILIAFELYPSVPGHVCTSRDVYMARCFSPDLSERKKRKNVKFISLLPELIDLIFNGLLAAGTLVGCHQSLCESSDALSSLATE
jgi:hypothetical protein